MNRYSIFARPAETASGKPCAAVSFEDERIFGLGDASRENLQRRPGVYEIWVKNMTCYRLPVRPLRTGDRLAALRHVREADGCGIIRGGAALWSWRECRKP